MSRSSEVTRGPLRYQVIGTSFCVKSVISITEIVKPSRGRPRPAEGTGLMDLQGVSIFMVASRLGF